MANTMNATPAATNGPIEWPLPHLISMWAYCMIRMMMMMVHTYPYILPQLSARSKQHTNPMTSNVPIISIRFSLSFMETPLRSTVSLSRIRSKVKATPPTMTLNQKSHLQLSRSTKTPPRNLNRMLIYGICVSFYYQGGGVGIHL